MEHFIEYLIVVVLLLWSLQVVLRRLLPKTSFAAQQAVARWLQQRGFARLGSWLMPKSQQSGCASGCSDCNADIPKLSCPTSSATTSEVKEQPVQWR